MENLKVKMNGPNARKIVRLNPAMMESLGPSFFFDSAQEMWCEYFAECSAMFVLHPVKEGGSHKVIAFSTDKSVDLPAFQTRFGEVVAETKVSLPPIDIIECPGYIALVLPWYCRCEFRALLLHVYRDLAKQKVKSAPVIVEMSSEFDDDDRPSLIPVSVWSSKSRRNWPELRPFRNQFDTTVGMFMGRILGGRKENTWELPMGCLVQEISEYGRVSWIVSFNDYDMTERVQVLLDAFMLKRKNEFHLLIQKHPYMKSAINDGLETFIVGTCICAKKNSREVRGQMTRLLRCLFEHLEQFVYMKPPKAPLPLVVV